MRFRSIFAALGLVIAVGVAPAHAADKVIFGTNWFAQAEHGGFYQALADGTYAKYGLDVTIAPGGPKAGNRQLLAAGKIDLYMGSTTGALAALAQGVPTLTIAAMFQKDPQVLIAHPEAGFKTLADLAKASKYLIAKDGMFTYFAWVRAKYPAFTEDKVEPYTFSAAPFLADKTAIQQGYVTSEPYAIEKEGGFKPDVFLLADDGYESYATTIEVMKPWYEAHKDVAKRFVEASIIGWYNYLYGDNAAANALIVKDNPDMDPARIDAGVEAMKAYGLLTSGDAEEGGIGCLNPARWQRFYESLSAIGVVPAGLDAGAALDASLVCQGLGRELQK